VLRTACALALLATCAFAARSAAACEYAQGTRVVMAGGQIDPNVFVWDTKQSAIDYAAGAWKSAREVMVHTRLVGPGTRATVVACVPEAIKPRYSERVEDAIGLRVLDGPNRGRYGWAYAEDVHPDVKATRARAARL